MLSKFALDATLPLVRPDSIVRQMTAGLWGLYTPSCWPDKDTEYGWVILVGEKDELLYELKRIGEVSFDGNITYTISKILIDVEWWKHRAEDGMIPDSILEGKT